MLNIRDLKIDVASLGEKKLLVEVVPAYEYKDKQRTDNITGYRYVIPLEQQYPEIQKCKLETWNAFLRRIHTVTEYRKGGFIREVKHANPETQL